MGKAADLVAKTLLQVRVQQSEAAALSLWTQSQLEWTSLGVKSEDVEEFVSRQVSGCDEGGCPGVCVRREGVREWV